MKDSKELSKSSFGYLDSNGDPVSLKARYNRGGYRVAQHYLHNTDPDANIARQYSSTEAAQADADKLLAEGRQHVTENLGAYVAQAEAEMNQDFELRQTGYHGNLPVGAVPPVQTAAHFEGRDTQ